MSNDTRAKLGDLISELDQVILSIELRAAEVGISPYQLRTPDGSVAMVEPLIAKANAELALAGLHAGDACTCAPER